MYSLCHDCCRQSPGRCWHWQPPIHPCRPFSFFAVAVVGGSQTGSGGRPSTPAGLGSGLPGPRQAQQQAGAGEAGQAGAAGGRAVGPARPSAPAGLGGGLPPAVSARGAGQGSGAGPVVAQRRTAPATTDTVPANGEAGLPMLPSPQSAWLHGAYEPPAQTVPVDKGWQVPGSAPSCPL